MSSTSSTLAPATKAKAWTSFSKLRRRATAMPKRNDHYRRFQAVASTILNLYPVSESSEITPVELDDPEEVEATLRDSLDPPATVFGDEFFTSAMYPLRLLYDIARFYDVSAISLDWLEEIGPSPSDERDKSIVAVQWLCNMLAMAPSDARLIIDEFKNSRKLNGISSNTMAAAPVLRTTAPSTSTEPPVPPPFFDAAPLAPSTTAVDSKDAQGGIPRVDTGRHERIESLHHRNRRETSAISAEYAQMKKSNFITSHFYKKKFTGALTESIAVTLRDYRHASGLYKLDDACMADNFGLALEDPAKDFFLSTVQPGMSFEDISAFMIAEYNSNSRQIQVRRMLDTMRIDTFMAEKGITSEQAALTDMISTIDSMVPQCPPAFRSDANKISFLRQALIKQPWATHAITKVDAGDVTWRQFTTDLHAALSLRREVHPVSDTHSHFTESDIDREARIFMTKYGRDPRYTRKYDYRESRRSYNQPRQDRSQPERAAPADRDSLSFEEARKLGLCKRCRKDWTPGHRCNGQSIRDHVKSRMRRGDHATHVMAELIQALESEPHDENDREEEDTATHLVEQDISELDAVLNEEPSHEHNDSAFVTHFLSSAFSTSIVDSPIEIPKITGTHVIPCQRS